MNIEQGVLQCCTNIVVSVYKQFVERSGRGWIRSEADKSITGMLL